MMMEILYQWYSKRKKLLCMVRKRKFRGLRPTRQTMTRPQHPGYDSVPWFGGGVAEFWEGLSLGWFCGPELEAGNQHRFFEISWFIIFFKKYWSCSIKWLALKRIKYDALYTQFVFDLWFFSELQSCGYKPTTPFVNPIYISTKDCVFRVEQGIV